jgi:hypothetical protein
MPGIPDIDIGLASDHPSIRNVWRGLACQQLARLRDIFSIGNPHGGNHIFRRCNWLVRRRTVTA